MFSDIHMCSNSGLDLPEPPIETPGIPLCGIAWQILALCLAVRVAVKHFRELQATSIGWTVTDCFTILIRAHVFYFIR
jgi:hypothetical protein